jgi:hypothetical protein
MRPPRPQIFVLLVIAMSCWISCTQQHGPEVGGSSTDGAWVAPPRRCGEPELADVRSSADQSLGVLEIFNDSSHLYLTYAPSAGSILTAFQIYYGGEEAVPRNTAGEADIAKFPLHAEGLKETQERTLRIAWGDMPTCILIAANFQIIQNGTMITGVAGLVQDSAQLHGAHYCRQTCQVVVLDCAIDDLGRLPQTIPQDQWAKSVAEEPTRLVHRHFKRLFPKGIILGCSDHLSFPTAELALSAMPSEGPAQVLETTQESGFHGSNRLVGELLSLTIMIGLDETMLEFTPHSAPLKRLVVATGAFEGWTVDEVAREANSILGGCTSNFTADQIYEVVREINLSFANPLETTHFLRCPQS